MEKRPVDFTRQEVASQFYTDVLCQLCGVMTALCVKWLNDESARFVCKH